MEKQIDKESVHTWCPSCKLEIDTVWVCRLESTSILRYAYFCSNCQKKLGVFSRKGFPPANVFKSSVNSSKL